MRFEFDANKRIENIGKHGFDFKRIEDVFEEGIEIGRSDRSG